MKRIKGEDRNLSVLQIDEDLCKIMKVWQSELFTETSAKDENKVNFTLQDIEKQAPSCESIILSVVICLLFYLDSDKKSLEEKKLRFVLYF